MAAAITTLSKLIISDSADHLTNPLRLDFAEFDIGIMLEQKNMNGTRGKYDEDIERVRVNRTTISPRYRGEPTALEWATLLPWALGATASGTTYALGNNVYQKYMRFDPSNGKKWQFVGVAVDALTMRSSSGEPLSCDLDLVGMTYSNPVDSFPAGNLDITTQPFLLSDCVLTWDGSTRNFRDMSVSVRNNIDRGRFLNSQTLTATNKLHREIVWSIELPSGDYDSLWDSGDGANSGANLSAVFTNGATSITLASTAVNLIPVAPMHPFQNEGMLRLEGKAYSLAGASSFTVTLDSTP